MYGRIIHSMPYISYYIMQYPFIQFAPRTKSFVSLELFICASASVSTFTSCNHSKKPNHFIYYMYIQHTILKHINIHREIRIAAQ